MSRLIETIKIRNGKAYNLKYHNKRMNATRRKIWGCKRDIDLSDKIAAKKVEELTKCRVIYDKDIQDIQFVPYELPLIYSLKLVYDNEISYSYKYENRDALKQLFDKRNGCDDILIVKEGKVTDSYFCNVVFEKKGKFYTPYSCLLSGTKRQKLITNERVKEIEVKAEDIQHFDCVHLINAMIDLEDDISVDKENILL
ncbi:MAG TPA: aminotransferase class IV [Chitinophagaceae bacterium]|nr:aminotransferase class IV [Chitinophagaceae bacterium]